MTNEWQARMNGILEIKRLRITSLWILKEKGDLFPRILFCTIRRLLKDLVKRDLENNYQGQDSASCPEPEAPSWGDKRPKDTVKLTKFRVPPLSLMCSTLLCRFFFSLLPTYIFQSTELYSYSFFSWEKKSDISHLNASVNKV